MLSAPTAITPRSAAHSVPLLATPAARRYASSSCHSVANPVRTNSTSPARGSTPCFAAHARRSSPVTLYLSGSRPTPFHPPTSSNTPRPTSCGTVSPPSWGKPARVPPLSAATPPSTFTPHHRLHTPPLRIS